MRAEYQTSSGERLVVLGSDRAGASARRVMIGRSLRAEVARKTGICSVCEQVGPTTEIDAAGRCRECQP